MGYRTHCDYCDAQIKADEPITLEITYPDTMPTELEFCCDECLNKALDYGRKLNRIESGNILPLPEYFKG